MQCIRQPMGGGRTGHADQGNICLFSAMQFVPPSPCKKGGEAPRGMALQTSYRPARQTARPVALPQRQLIHCLFTSFQAVVPHAGRIRLLHHAGWRVFRRFRWMELLQDAS